MPRGPASQSMIAIDSVVLWPLGRRPLDNVADLKIPRIQAVYRIPL